MLNVHIKYLKIFHMKRIETNDNISVERMNNRLKVLS